MGAPPGGPDDKVAPKLIGTLPESVGVYPSWNHDVEFRFDEVVNEGSSPSQGFGTGDLEKLVLVSPSKEIPYIHWKRDRITVKPREGWKPNRVYRIELLPGVTDLRRNRMDSATVLTFSTGGAIPTDTMSGVAIDWVAGRPAVSALVELMLPDSLIYRTLTDSSGRFSIGPLPHGDYRLYAAVDQNKNLRRERREAYDSTALPAGTLVAAPLWLIPRDTVGPRMQTLTPDDSLSATISFSQQLDPYQSPESLTVRFRLQADSSAVPYRSLLPKSVDDSLQKLARAVADSVRAANDTTKKPEPAPPRPAKPIPEGPAPTRAGGGKGDPAVDSILHSRPGLYDKLVLRVDSAFVPNTKYILEVQGIRSAAGVASNAHGVLAIPKPKPPTEAPKDSVTAPRDSVTTPADSTTPPAPPPPKPSRR